MYKDVCFKDTAHPEYVRSAAESQRAQPHTTAKLIVGTLQVQCGWPIVGCNKQNPNRLAYAGAWPTD